MMPIRAVDTRNAGLLAGRIFGELLIIITGLLIAWNNKFLPASDLADRRHPKPTVSNQLSAYPDMLTSGSGTNSS